MNFLTYNSKNPREDDLVIMCMGRERLIPLRLKRDQICQIRGGAISHNAIMTKSFGDKVYTTNGKSWVTILHPTPELWTVTLPHRTQILYSTDISIITMYLELRPGSVVCESGTGSASLSHAIARTIFPHGHLYTFEFHKERTEIAKEEFSNHGLDHVTIEHRDVIKDGFGISDKCDAVFLDLPKPWEVIPSAKKALKTTGGRVCSFSPCIEQVQRTCEVLRALGFTDIEMMECLYRPFDVRPCIINLPNLEGQVDKGDDTITPSSITYSPVSSSLNMYTCAPHRDIPGHTGFLTFGTMI